MSVEPVRKTLTVPLEPERAFDLFTHGIGSWWPLETHSRAGEVEGATVERVEFPTEPGRPILERLSTGDAFPWGELAASEPPHRVVIAWKPNANPNPPTEVEVTFTADGEGTRIELEHRAWEALGDLAAEGRAGYDEGWDLVLGRYEAAANT
jgi:uncharacterized protein YndB with AHSA1/START domain